MERDEKLRIIAELFPNAVTEILNKNGQVVRAIDPDILNLELNGGLTSSQTERYQFTWPEKKRKLLLASRKPNKTLRLIREASRGRNNEPGLIDSENIYIEGDNLDALKLLQETYLGRVKMIYIDPPYNTGKDFIYRNDYSQEKRGYVPVSGQTDDEGNRLVKNLETDGRFHTDWLNMIYPRLRIAKDFLSEDGVIFISIDDNEQANLRKICDEIFGERNFIAQLVWKGRGGRQDSKYLAVIHEYILCYARNSDRFTAGEETKEGESYPKYDEARQRSYKTQLLRKWGTNSRREDRPNLFYPITAPDGSEVYPMLSDGREGRWRWGTDTMSQAIEEGRVEFQKTGGGWIPYEKIYAPLDGEERTKKYTTWLDGIPNGTDTLKELAIPFDYPKSPELISRLAKIANLDSDSIVFDFFSGSATTAHALLSLNAQDSGHRKFILVQLPEPTPPNSEARKAGYATICDIGRERIARAAEKILAEFPLSAHELDAGFRVFRVDSSNMKNVYLTPEETTQEMLPFLASNIKEERTPEDLLIQVMLELGVPLSSRIDERFIDGKKIFSVDNGYIIACFDENVTNETVKAIAKEHPDYAVFRDSSFASDSVMINSEQILAAYSPQTRRKIL